MTFVLIEFPLDQGGGLSVVRSDWITPRKTEVFWPPYRNPSQYNKALKNGEEINTEKWKLYKIERCFYSCDDYDKIQKKLQQCMCTSDIQTDKDNSEKKRKRSRPKKLLSSSEEEQDTSKLPRPPNLIKNRKKDSNSTCNRHDESLVDKLSQSFEIEGRVDPNVLYTPNNSRQAASEFPTGSSRFQVSTSVDHTAAIRKILAELVYLKEQNNQIILRLDQQKQQIQRSANQDLPDLPVVLPVKSLGDLQILDRNLRENLEHSSALSTHLSRLGGNDLTTKTNRILRFMLSDEVAQHYNFCGSRSIKKPFSELTLKNIVIRAVKTNNSTFNEQNVEDIIKIWLKHAPGRLKSLKKHKVVERIQDSE